MAARGRFANSCDFLVAVASFAAGPLVFKLPMSMYFGGGAYFLIGMLLYGIIFALPMASIEMSLGHISGLAPTATFGAISPSLRVLGWIQTIVCAFFTVSISRRSAQYLGLTVASFFGNSVFNCEHAWNDQGCRTPTESYETYLHGSENVSFSSSSYGAEQFVDAYLPSDKTSMAVAILILVVWLLVLAGTVVGPKIIGKLLYVLFFLPIVLLVLIYFVITFLDVFESPAGLKTPSGLSRPIYEDKSSAYLFGPDMSSFLTVATVVDSIGYIMVGMGVYHTLASFHRHSETVNQPVPRWKIATIAPWVIFASMTFTGVIISLIHFKSLYFISHSEGVSLRDHALLTDQQFLSVPMAFAVLNLGSIWTVLFYLALFLLCIGTMIPMFLSVVTGVTDAIHKLGGKKVLTAIALAIIHMICSQISFSDILKFMETMNSSLLDVVLLLFLITVGLFYGWHELQKDTMLALGIPRSISDLRQFFSPASQYHTALLLIVGPFFVGIIAYAKFKRAKLLSAENYQHENVNFLILIIFVFILLFATLLAIIDCIFLLNRKPVLFAFLKRGFWNPLRYEAEEVGHKPPLGNDRLCWCCCDYSKALVFVMVLEAISVIVALTSLILSVVLDYPTSLDRPIIVFVNVLMWILSLWSLLGICRSRAQRSSDFLMPYLLNKILLAFIAPLMLIGGTGYDDFRPLLPLIFSLVFLFIQGFLVAVVVGAHWRYRAKSQQYYNQIPMEPIISARI